MRYIHGGEHHNNSIKIDFSVNTNPLEVPQSVKDALIAAVECCQEYPDIRAGALKTAVGRMLSVPEEVLLLGNGASELLAAVVHGLSPRRIVIPVPSFYGYEYVAGMTGAEVLYYETKEENDFELREDIFGLLTEEVDMLFLANPNNPNGRLQNPVLLRELIRHCEEKGIYVVLDECFIEFCGAVLENPEKCGASISLISDTEEYSNLMIVRAFTKIYCIPGVRLGYLICRNPMLLQKVQRQLPEWNVSTFAQMAGIACAEERKYLQETVTYVKRERAFLEEGLRKAGMKVYPGEANFLLFHSDMSDVDLQEELRKQGIIIRDCENFRGLGKGYYRVAVRTRKENEVLLKAIVTERKKYE